MKIPLLARRILRGFRGGSHLSGGWIDGGERGISLSGGYVVGVHDIQVQPLMVRDVRV